MVKDKQGLINILIKCSFLFYLFVFISQYQKMGEIGFQSFNINNLKVILQNLLNINLIYMKQGKGLKF